MGGIGEKKGRAKWRNYNTISQNKRYKIRVSTTKWWL